MCLARIPDSLIPKLGRCNNEVSNSHSFARHGVKTVLILVLLAEGITCKAGNYNRTFSDIQQ